MNVKAKHVIVPLVMGYIVFKFLASLSDPPSLSQGAFDLAYSNWVTAGYPCHGAGHDHIEQLARAAKQPTNVIMGIRQMCSDQ